MVKRLPSLAAWPPTLRWLIWGVYVVTWTYYLLTPNPPLRDMFLEPTSRYLIAKTVHVGAYAVLTILCSWLPVRGRWRWLLVAFVSLHGMATEYLQQFFERGSSWRDVGFDHLGLALGLVISWRWWRRPPLLTRGTKEA